MTTIDDPALIMSEIAALVSEDKDSIELDEDLMSDFKFQASRFDLALEDFEIEKKTDTGDTLIIGLMES